MEYKKIIISYNEYGRLLEKLCKKIQKGYEYTSYKIEAVYGPLRGGLPIAVHVSHYLNCDLILDIKDLYEIALHRKHFIIVDDIVDTGQTMLEFPKVLMYTYGDTASIFYKPRSIFKPRFYVEEIKDDDWIVFPYEKLEEDPNR